MEFVDYLNHVGLGHIPRLTRLEWSVIKRFVQVMLLDAARECRYIIKKNSFFAVLLVDPEDSLRDFYRKSGRNLNSTANLYESIIQSFEWVLGKGFLQIWLGHYQLGTESLPSIPKHGRFMMGKFSPLTITNATFCSMTWA